MSSSSSSSTATADTTSTSPYFTSLPSTSTSTDASSSDGGTNNNNNNNNGITTSSSLYLFTFLATLLLLLAVSCAIVVRSLVLRRRFRRRVQEALANGIVLPPAPGGLFGAAARGAARRDFGEKPTMWDRWLAPPHELDLAGAYAAKMKAEDEDADADEKAGDGDGDVRRWDDIMPVSAKIISAKLSGDGQPLPESTRAPARPSVLRSISGAGSGLRRWPFFHRSSPAPAQRSPPDAPNASVSAPAPDASAPPPPAETDADADAQLQLSVLIAMPSRFRPRAWDPQRSAPLKAHLHHLHGTAPAADSSSSTHDGEDDLPEVVFGVAEVPWKVYPPSSPSASSAGTPAQTTQLGTERAQL